MALILFFLIWLCAFYQRPANITELILLRASSARWQQINSRVTLLNERSFQSGKNSLVDIEF